MKTQFDTPDLHVEVSTIDGFHVRVSGIEAGGDIVSITTMSSRTDPSGSFNFVIVDRNLEVATWLRREIIYYSDGWKNPTSWFQVLQTRTLVDIYIDGVEQLIGVVTSIQRVGSVAGEFKGYSVSGVSLGHALKEMCVVWDRCEKYNPKWTVSGIFQWLPEDLEHFRAISSAEEAMENRYEVWNAAIRGKMDFDYRFANGKKIEDLISVKRSANGGTLSEMHYAQDLPWSKDLFVYEGDYWQYFKSLISAPFNELFVDCGDREIRLWNEDTVHETRISDLSRRAGTLTPHIEPGYKQTVRLKRGMVHLIFRPSPLDDDDLGISGFSYLRYQDIVKSAEAVKPPKFQEYVAIVDEDIVTTSLAATSDSLYTAFYVTFGGHSLINPAKLALAPMEYVEDAIALYGYKLLKANIEGIDYSAMDVPRALEGPYVDWLQKKLRSWYQWSDKMLGGGFHLRGNPYLRPGKYLLNLTRENRFERRRYYIDAVTQSYVYGSGFTSKVQVSRGIPFKDGSEGLRGETFAPRILPELRESTVAVESDPSDPALDINNDEFWERLESFQVQKNTEALTDAP